MVYEPREDSLLLAKSVAYFAKGDVLDMGTGSGIQAITAAKSRKVKKVLAVDINKKALAYAKKENKHTKIKYAHSDLFNHIKKKKFDTIIFNPPYLPNDSRVKDIALDGGVKGYELTEKFLSKAGNFLTDTGSILLLFSSLTKKNKIEEFIGHYGFDFKALDKKKFAFETLYVYCLSKKKIIVKLGKKGIKDIVSFTHGHRGVLYKGKFKGKKVVIKAQRYDISARETVNNEIYQLKKLNKKKIGPRVVFSGNGFFGYPFVEGDFILDFIKKAKRKQIIDVLKEVFRQMYIIDEMNLNKEEMHHPWKHVIVGKKGKVTLLDFERCKYTSKPHNVSQWCEALCRCAGELKKKGIVVDKEKMRGLAKKYQEERNKKNLKIILETLK